MGSHEMDYNRISFALRPDFSWPLYKEWVRIGQEWKQGTLWLLQESA
jgi:hypothetical protein